jgi:GAF domain-containing protein
VDVETDADVLRLRAVLRDLVALSAIPAAWIGSEPPAVAAGLADALVGLLKLDFAFVRLSDPGGAGAVEVTQGSAWTSFPEWLEGRLARGAPFPGKDVVPDVGDDSARRRGFAVPVGVNGEGGVVAAASERSDFPTPMEQLLLSLAANHAAAAFQSARLVHERKRAEDELRKARNELEVKVAERTSELHTANDELNALRRVATLVAEGVQPQDLFAVVAEQVARVVNVPLVSVARYELDGTATECASFSPEGPLFPVGRRWSLEGRNVLQLVRENCEAARIDDYSQLEGEIVEVVRRAGIRSTVGIPIVVAGRVWGAMVVSTFPDLDLGPGRRRHRHRGGRPGGGGGRRRGPGGRPGECGRDHGRLPATGRGRRRHLGAGVRGQRHRGHAPDRSRAAHHARRRGWLDRQCLCGSSLARVEDSHQAGRMS